MKKAIFISIIILYTLFYIGIAESENINKSGRIFYTDIIKKTRTTLDRMKTFDVNLFSAVDNSGMTKIIEVYAGNVNIMRLKDKDLIYFYNNPSEIINFKIPVEGFDLILKKNKILADDFTLKTLSGNGSNIIYNYREGVYYQGYIKGKPESFAAISIFENDIMGIISDERGNFILGESKINGLEKYYVFYNDVDLKVADNFICKTGDFPDKFYKTDDNYKNGGAIQNPNLQNLPVKMYFEADYQMYLDFNSNVNDVGNFITGFFNVVSYMYQRERIPFVLRSIDVWTEIDPYYYLNDSYPILLKFGGRSKDNFEGNLAHLLSTGHNQELGGIAWIGILCQPFNQSDSSGRYAFSNISPDYNGFPTYSWTVNCVRHEIGHNLGSMHTHACWWPLPNNTIGALDSCYYAEMGFCFSNPRPSVGTIMSYCHLWQGQGGSVNFNLGFGPRPGDTIRLRYNQAGCLDRELNSSELPIVFDLAQNFPNPFNPVTVISYAVPQDAFVKITVYNISGKEVTSLVNDYKKAGFYKVIFNASGLSSGVYFYKMQAGNFTQTKQMVLIK